LVIRSLRAWVDDADGVIESEPFDTKLAQHIQSISAQIEKEQLQLANLRRTAPARTAKRFQDSFEKTSEQEDARLQKAQEVQLDSARQTKMEVSVPERLDEMQASLRTGSETLHTLKPGYERSLSGMGRAQEAMDFVEGKKS
jgi:kinetochor protein Mis14/NSL1